MTEAIFIEVRAREEAAKAANRRVSVSGMLGIPGVSETPPIPAGAAEEPAEKADYANLSCLLSELWGSQDHRVPASGGRGRFRAHGR